MKAGKIFRSIIIFSLTMFVIMALFMLFYQLDLGLIQAFAIQSLDQAGDNVHCSYIYLPGTFKNYVNLKYTETFWEEEPNGAYDDYSKANGVSLNVIYSGTITNSDSYDRFGFYITSTTTITTEVWNHDVKAGQLILDDYKQEPATADPDDSYVYTPTHHLMVFPDLAPGYYYLSLHTNVNQPYTTTSVYTLQVSTPPDYVPPEIPNTYTAVFDGNEFNGGKLVADKTLEYARTALVPKTVPTGTYRITLHSSDDHNSGQVQLEEKWYLEFYNQADELIAQTLSTEDLDEDRNCQFDVVEDSFVLPEEAVNVRAMHTAYSTTEPHSVWPERAIIEEILP